MEIVIVVLATIALAGSIVFLLKARKYRVEGAPSIPSWNPVHWFQPWRIPDWLTPKGFRLYFYSYVCMMVALGLMMLYIILPHMFT